MSDGSGERDPLAFAPRVLDTDTGRVIAADSLPRTTILYARAKDGDTYRYQPIRDGSK